SATRQRIDGCDAEPLQDTREATEDAAQHEVADLDPVDVDAGLAGPEQVAASRDRVQAPFSKGEHNLHHNNDSDGPDDLRVRAVAKHLVESPHIWCEYGKALGNGECKPGEQEECTQRGDE